MAIRALGQLRDEARDAADFQIGAVQLASYPADVLEVCAWGNEVPAFGALVRAEMARRDRLEAE